MLREKIVGIIPARIASSRFPKKMLADIFGKSLIQRTYENASRAKSLSNLIIATDDPLLLTHIQSFGATGVLTSPNCPTGSDRVAEAAKTHYPDAEIIVNIQGDEPCLDPEVIDKLVEVLIEKKDAVAATAVAPLQSSALLYKPSIVKCVFDRTGRALYFSRAAIPFQQSVQAETKHYRHIGIYAYKADFLNIYSSLTHTPCQKSEDLEQLKILEYGFPIYVTIVDDQAIGVDTPEDLEEIKKILCQENISLSQAGLSPR